MTATFWGKNINLYKKKWPEIALSFDKPPEPTGRVSTFIAKNGLPGFIYRTENGQRRHFHSAYDPKSEAEEWAAEVDITDGSVVVILGGAFFYHVIALLKRIPGRCNVVVIEKDKEIFYEALKTVDLSEALGRENLHCLAGVSAAEAVEFINALRRNSRLKKTSILSHPPSVKTFPEYYGLIVRAFGHVPRVTVSERLRYKKFHGSQTRALLITTRYFLMGEIIGAMQKTGIQFRMTAIEQDEMGKQEFIEEIIKDILDFRPDFLFTVNHLGLDQEGYLSDFLTGIEMPFASWYVDNPNLIIGHYRKNITPFCVLFVWDENAVADMKTLGFEHVFHSPLGVDEGRFRPLTKPENTLFPHGIDVAFVGNSMVKKVEERLRRISVDGGLKAHFASIAGLYAESIETHVDRLMEASFPKLYSEYKNLSAGAQADYETAITWEATRLYRLRRVEELLPFHPVIAGDPYWHEILEGRKFFYHPELAYYTELPYLYNATAINFNATSRQMKGALNQRIFDVPACNRFLLTDFQEQLADQFDIGNEVICYRHPEEIGDLVRFYLAHDTERIRIAENGHRRALKDHTYSSRVTKIVQTMRQLFN